MSHRCGSRRAAAEPREVGLRRRQVVHVAPRAPHRDEDERDPHPAGECDVERRAGADRHDDRDGELRDRGAEVAAGGVEAERPALLLLREEVGDVRHRAREVAAADAAEGGDEQQHAERRLGVGDDDAEQHRRDEQEARRDDRPVAPAEDRDHERVREPQGRADEARQRDEPEQLRAGELEAGGGQHHDDDAPQLPDDEAEELREDRPAEVAAGDRPPLGLPRTSASSGFQPSTQRPGAAGEGDAVDVTDAGAAAASVVDDVTVVVMAPPQ